MKILDFNQFVSERMKIKPVTNAELDKIQKEIEKNPVMAGEDPYKFLSNYVDPKILNEVQEIRTLRTGNIRLVLGADKFHVTESPLQCTIYLKDNCWRTIIGGRPSRRGPYSTFDEMMEAFNKWITKKYDKMH